MKGSIACLFCLITLAGLAQTTVGLQMGYNNAKLSKYGKGTISPETRNSSVNSFHIGVAAEISLGGNIFLAPALLYFGNGSHITDDYITPGGALIDNFTVRLNYLRLPISILYKMHTARAVHLFIGAGLYVARGLSGTQKGYSESSFLMTANAVQTIDRKINFSSGYSGSNDNTNAIWISPYDFGYSFLAGIEWKKFKWIADIGNGLVAAHRGQYYDLKNSSFSISLIVELTNFR